MYVMCPLKAWGCQGAHNGLCDSLGWQGGDFAFSASFLILNEIMPTGDGIFGERDITSGKEAGTKFSHVVFIYELSLAKLFRSYQTDNNQI